MLSDRDTMLEKRRARPESMRFFCESPLSMSLIPGASNTSSLAAANQAYRARAYDQAILHYIRVLHANPGLARAIMPSLLRAQASFLDARRAALSANPSSLCAGICGWEMSHNAAGRVATLAQLYQAFANVQILGCIFSATGRGVWEPISQSARLMSLLRIEDRAQFLEQAILYVAGHPLDIVHLSKPRAPNILIGLLYKLIWQAQVIVDVDDEELGFVGAQEPLEIAHYLREQGGLPSLESIPFKEWTQIAVGLVDSFDGVTVANAVLQARYRGQIIPHVRDEEVFRPSAQWPEESRAHYGIAPHRKVVLFFGTPRAHKGLTETAAAIAALHDPDILFLIAGDFPDPRLQQTLQGICGVDYLFLGNQPFSDVPRIVSLANACVLLQDASTSVGRYQSPAKLTDALAMGLPVITSPSEVMADVIERGAAISATAAELPLVLKEVLDGGPAIKALSRRARTYFEAHLSIAANQPHLKELTQVVMQYADGVTREVSADLKTLASALGDARINALLA